MQYQDSVYGKVEIDEPVVLELIESYELQRLKGVDQAGYIEPYHPGCRHNRFDHSVGVYILLKKFGAPIEEQVAGLIHDVSHSAFSHAVDYALSKGSEKEQNHQDNYFKDYVLNSGLPKILEKYGFDIKFILNEKNFPLLETQLPDLCADRIDYSLREALIFKCLNENGVSRILDNLIIKNKKWIFKNFETAYEYSKTFKNLNDEYFSSLITAVMFRRVGDYLKHAMLKGYISKKDLYTTDDEVISKINKNLDKDKELEKLWKRMNNGKGYENNSRNFDAEVFCKSRVVDPLCFKNGEIKRVSDVEPSWKNIVQEESKPKRYFIKFYD